MQSLCALVLLCVSVLIRRITESCFFHKASTDVINPWFNTVTVPCTTAHLCPSFLLVSPRRITGQTDFLCEREASRVELQMKRNGCRVNVIHCGQGIKWDQAKREHRSKGDKSFAVKIINAALILMNSISRLFQALSSCLSLSLCHFYSLPLT